MVKIRGFLGKGVLRTRARLYKGLIFENKNDFIGIFSLETFKWCVTWPLSFIIMQNGHLTIQNEKRP